MTKESNDKPGGSTNWWQTAPGIITAVAALMTATGGFLITMNQIGCFDKATGPNSNNTEERQSEKKEDKEISPDEHIDDSKNEKDSLNTNENKKFPDVNFEGNVYKFLSVKLDYYSPKHSTIMFKFQLMTKATGVYLNEDFFRLLVGSNKLSPVSGTVEWVGGYNVKEAEVAFIIPEDASKVQLQIGDVNKGEDQTVKVQFDLNKIKL